MTNEVPELALDILVNQVVHFSDCIILEDVNRYKNWEAFEYFWEQLPDALKEGEASEDMLPARHAMCKALVVSTSIDPYDEEDPKQGAKKGRSKDILPIPAPPLVQFTKDMWEALIELLNEIVVLLEGNEDDAPFKGVIDLRRAIHAQRVIADFRVDLEHFANQGDEEESTRPETAALREVLREQAAAVLEAVKTEDYADDKEMVNIFKSMVETKTSSKRKGAGEYAQFVSAGKLRKILNNKPFGLTFIRHKFNKLMMEWGTDNFQSVSARAIDQGIEQAMQADPLDQSGTPARGVTTSTGRKSTGNKRKAKYNGSDVPKEPNQVLPPPVVHKSDGSRKKMRFSEAEKEAIRQGVLKFGVGKWAQTKSAHEVTLRNRTSVMIKDCYRTMCKRGEFHPPLKTEDLGVIPIPATMPDLPAESPAELPAETSEEPAETAMI